jgi:pimeloyl-ACP methyl ester carboxylesterase
LSVEALLRGSGDRRQAEGLLSSAVTEPWFELAYLDDVLPGHGETWPDMDYDPAVAFADVSCPTLLIYGEDEECVPADASIAVWRRAKKSSGDLSGLTVVGLPDCGHFPARDADSSSLRVPLSSFSPAYTSAIQQWLVWRSNDDRG